MAKSGRKSAAAATGKPARSVKTRKASAGKATRGAGIAAPRSPRKSAPRTAQAAPRAERTARPAKKSARNVAATPAKSALAAKLAFRPLTPDLWPELERLFGERGACGGCWCMAWRLPSAEFARHKGEGNRALFRQAVQTGPPPGMLAFAGDEPVGWCAIAPREVFVRLQTSRVLKPLDGTPVWSISCLFVARPWRRKGLSSKLIDAAVQMAREHGATTVEAYPILPRQEVVPDVFAWTGIPICFERAGFENAGCHSKARPIMRRSVRG